jgi:hypothetical protein
VPEAVQEARGDSIYVLIEQQPHPGAADMWMSSAASMSIAY